MKCRKYKILISDYADGSISESGKLILESHLESCSSCRKKLESLRYYKKFSEAYEQKEPPGSIKEEAWDSVSRIVRDEEKHPESRVTGLTLTWTTAAAAIIALVIIVSPFFNQDNLSISFCYIPEKTGKGPSKESNPISFADARVSAVSALAQKMDLETNNISSDPSGISDGMSIKVPRSKYPEFRDEFNSIHAFEKLPELSFRSKRGYVNIQVYFPGRKLFTGDFNNDGLTDMGAYFNRGKNRREFFIAYNNGSEGFRKASPAQINDTISFIYRSDKILTGDFNADGYDDLLFKYSKGTNRDKWIIYNNNRNDGFDKGRSIRFDEGEIPAMPADFLFTGDFDGDGYADVGVHSYKGNHAGRFMISLNKGELSFSAPKEFMSGHSGLPSTQKYTPVILDMNNDGYSDIIIYWQEGERNAFWYVSENNLSGAGSKEYALRFNQRGTMAFMGNYLPFTGDMNGDGLVDLLVKISTSDEVSNWYLMINDGDGSFNSAGHFIDFSGEIDLIVR